MDSKLRVDNDRLQFNLIKYEIDFIDKDKDREL